MRISPMKFRVSPVFVILAALIGLLAACSGGTAPTPTAELDIALVGPEALPTSVFDDPALQRGEANYQRYCAHCHGYQGEGQTGDSAAETRAMGMKLVPAHDSTGVIWQYADQVLLRMTKQGITNGLNRYPMPAFDTTFDDAGIMEIYAYIKTWWTEEQRAYQAEVTRKLQTIWDELGVETTPESPFPTVTPAAGS